MSPGTSPEGGLLGLMQHMGAGALDDTGRQARRLGSVLSGQGLSDAEIQSLPHVRFEKMEEQTCAVCFGEYRWGELITQLRCGHCFHVDCIAEWMHRATRCPLCRRDCAA